MLNVPNDLSQQLEALVPIARSIEGHLSPREIRFLGLLAACPTATGEVLEIGSYRGRSTVVLAKAMAAGTVHAVDPLTAPAITDQYKSENQTIAQDFYGNIEKHGVKARVAFNQMYSHELSPSWTLPLRLLWIDADHSYPGTKQDFDLFSRHLVDRGMIAFHDVLHPYDGPVRVFMEDVLASDRFGACGVVGSIGWAQRVYDPAIAAAHRLQKIALHKKLSRLVPYALNDRDTKALKKLAYKFWRSRVPHAEVQPSAWAKQLVA